MTSDNYKTSAVLFDLDGTLTDSLPLIRQTYFKVFNEMSIPWGDDDVMKWIGRTLQDIAVYFAGKEAAGLFIERYQIHYHRDHDQLMKLFPGTREMLEVLKKDGVKAGIVTSKGRPGTERTVEFTGIGSYMDVIVTAHDLDRHKPLPDPIFLALKAINVKPKEAVFVGDSRFDLESGKAAGVKVVGVSWGICSAVELMNYSPLGVIDSWEELIKKYI